jgi:predicted component of type VI protein secretion system
MTPLLQIDLRDRRTGATTRHTFHAGPVRIGRDPTCELCLADPTVSNHHAVLDIDETAAHLRDLGSKNGLHITGRRAKPHSVHRLIGRLQIEVGPFHLEISHRPNPTHHAAHGALPSEGAPDLDALHTLLTRLHALHAPLVAARKAFESALADAALALADDPAATRRLRAEFPTHAPPLQPPDIHLPDLSSGPALHLAPPDLSQTPSPLPLLAPLARAVLPGERPPASHDEARRFLDRVARVLRDLAAGLAALQHLRIQQCRSFDLIAGGPDNPILSMTRGDELLAHLLAWRTPAADTTAHELMDCHAVLLAHLRGHVHAALSTACHFATQLAPPEIERHTSTRGPLRAHALWRTYRERYESCVGTAAAPILKTTFKNSYCAELAELGVHLTPRP